MDKVTIRISPADIEAAKRIAERMFPNINTVEWQDVIRLAEYEGFQKLKVQWQIKEKL